MNGLLSFLVTALAWGGAAYVFSGTWVEVNYNYVNPPPRLCSDDVIKQAIGIVLVIRLD